jgi:hypothetical protein
MSSTKMILMLFSLVHKFDQQRCSSFQVQASLLPKKQKHKHLGDAEDDLVAAQELAEEAGGKVERIHLEELARQRAAYMRMQGCRR